MAVNLEEALSSKDAQAASSRAELALLSEFNTYLSSCKTERIPFERQWYTNLAFYFGRQYAVWSGNGVQSKLYEPPALPWRVRLVINKCKPVVRTEMSKLLKEHPRGYVVPNTSDDLDKAAARGALALYDALYQPNALHIEKQLTHALFWLSTCGNGFLKAYYSPKDIDFSGEIGKICVDPVSPWHIYIPDLIEPEIENQEYIIHESSKPVEWIKANFNVDVSPSTGPSSNGVDVRFILSLGVHHAPNASRKTATVREIWIKPNSKYPSGAVGLYTEDKLLGFMEELPYAHGQSPFTKLDHIPTGRFYNDSTLVDFIPLQKEYNKTMSQIIENRNATSKPQLTAVEGSIDVNQITNQPGLIITYKPGTTPPQVIPPPGIPQYVLNIVDRIQNDMNDTSSQHEVTRGSTPPGVTAATAIAYLQEEDDSKLGMTVRSIEAGAQKIGSQVLSLVSQYWELERSIKVAGNSNIVEVKAYKGSTLRGNTDYRVEPGSATPTSRAARQAFLMEMFDRQAISKDDLLKYLDMGETSKLYDESQIDARQAERENLALAAGEFQQVPSINPYDSDIAHIEVHQRYMKTEQFENLPPELKQMFSDHVKLHKGHLAAMYGRTDLLPQQIIDPATNRPVLGPDGTPLVAPDNPQLEGFIQQLKMAGPPPIAAPMMQQGQGSPNG